MTDDDKEHVLDAILWYQPLMLEVRIRLDIVDAICEGRLRLPLPYAREYAYLHFRKICELIGLGCMRLHGDLPSAQTKQARKTWQAVDMMKLLTNSHSTAFPKPISVSHNGKKMISRREIRKNALVLSEFATLYNECGDALHRGSINMLRYDKPLTTEDYQKIDMWRTKIIDLLSEHEVQRHNDRGYFVTRLIGENGYPECTHYSLSGKGGFHEIKQLMNVVDEPTTEVISPLGAAAYVIRIDGSNSAI